ncbi:MAG TPA: PilZ domain-containing protein [Polyangiaceae bacterium]
MLHSPLPHESGQRRQVLRVRADLRVVIALSDGEKIPARVVDLSIGGMNVRADRVPNYGEAVTVIVQLRQSADWYLIPATVRWFLHGDFGVAFENLDMAQSRALATFIDQAAA